MAEPKTSEQTKTTAETEFTSKLDKGAHRFLAHVVVHGMAIGRRSANDFIRHFSPATIMKGLDQRPHLRADILEVTTGVNRKIALKKGAASAGEDVQIALDEGVTTAEDIVRAFHPDDRVRHLDNKKLWSFVVEGEFWNIDPANKSEFERAKDHLAFILDRALTDRLIAHEDLVAGVSVDKLAECLPRAQLAKIIRSALALGKEKRVFTEEELLRAAAARVIVEDVSLRHLWETVVVTKIARVHGFEDEKATPAETSKSGKDAAASTAKTNGAAKGSSANGGRSGSRDTTSPAAKATEKSSEKTSDKETTKEMAAKSDKSDKSSKLEDKTEDPERTAVRTPPGIATKKQPRDLPEEVEVLQLDDEFDDFSDDGTDPGLRQAVTELE
jgi:hypothetical protein